MVQESMMRARSSNTLNRLEGGYIAMHLIQFIIIFLSNYIKPKDSSFIMSQMVQYIERRNHDCITSECCNIAAQPEQKYRA